MALPGRVLNDKRDVHGRRMELIMSPHEAATERLQLVVECAPNALVLIDQAGSITLVNAQTEKLFGYVRAELIGQPVELLVPERYRAGHPENRDRFFASPQSRAMGTGRDLFGLCKDGCEVPIEIGMNPIVTTEGTFVLAAIIDISDRKQAEAQIRAKNEELKTFAYTVSHDLKAPLRGIVGYSQELERNHQDDLPERAKFCLSQIIVAVKNLDCLIEDLLKYSRLDADTPVFTDVNLADVVQRVLKDRTHAMNFYGTVLTVEVPPLMRHTWERGLLQVLSNLIDNAIKYSQKANPPRLTVKAETTAGGWRISVADNGIGFDMKYHDRIFGLFNRLVRAGEYEGTGAGLAIVKKLVEKLGGTIHAESAPGKGATFLLEVKDAEPV